MPHRTKLIIRIIVLALIGGLPYTSAEAQDTSARPLGDQLKAQYKPDTVLVIQKDGLLGVPPNSLAICPAHFQDGKLHAPSNICKAMVSRTSHDLQTGDKVHAVKIDVNLKDEKVSVLITECDSCNGTGQPSSLKSEVIFHYPKGYLQAAEPDQVEDVISQVLAIDASTNDTQQTGQNTQGQQTVEAPTTPPQPPPTIQSGQTMEEVKAILGEPDKVVDLGAKKIYVYKDLKITFMNGKVSDVQ